MDKLNEERPWGKYERFCLNQVATVKILSIKPNSALSLQYHHQREEFWKVVSGEAEIIIGDNTKLGKEGDEFFIPKETKHQIKTNGSSVKILEIAFGHFDECDIIRLEDRYGRT